VHVHVHAIPQACMNTSQLTVATGLSYPFVLFY